MKKIIFTLTFLLQSVFVFAATPVMETRVTANEVKMYRQAGTSSAMVMPLKSTDEVVLIREHNANWSIVSGNGETGYVLSSELSISKKVSGKTKRSRS